MAIDRNIFAHSYHKNEDQHTEALMKFLANASDRVLSDFLSQLDLGLPEVRLDDVEMELQRSEAESRPDATLTSQKQGFRIHIETKLGPGFEPRQLSGHIRSLAREHFRVRAVVLLSGAIVEPPGFSGYQRTHISSDVTLRHLSWRNVMDFVSRVAREATDVRSSFLASQLAEYIEREVGMRWSGFESDFCEKWVGFLRFRDAHAKLLGVEVKAAIGALLAKEYPGYRLGSSLDRYSSGDRMFWNLRTKGSPELNLHIALASADGTTDEPALSVWWYGTASLARALAANRAYEKLQRRLELSHHFEFEGPTRIGRQKSIREIIGLSPDEQLAALLDFITITIRDFHRSGLMEAMHRASR